MKSSVKLISIMLAFAMAFTLQIEVQATEDISISNSPIIMGENIISDTLKYIEENTPRDVYRVIIWLDDIDTSSAVNTALKQLDANYEKRQAYLNATTEALTEQETAELNLYIATERAAKKSCYEPYTANFANNHINKNEIVYTSKYLPMVIADMSYERIEVLSKKIGVQKIDYYCDDAIDEEIDFFDLTTVDSTNQYYSVQSQLSYIDIYAMWGDWNSYGSGVNIGLLDVGNPDYTNDFFSEYLDNIHVQHSSANVRYHATRILEILLGAAPEANIFCTSYLSTGETLISALEWMMDNSVHVINISLNISGGYDYDSVNTYGAVAQYLDTVITQYNVVIVKSAGNTMDETITGVTSGGMGYNVITVGCYDRYNNVRCDFSSYNDDDLTLCFKPDLCAPGMTYFNFENDEGSLYGAGTSYSAPLVVGVTALLMSRFSSLRTDPTAIKSILTAAVDLSTHCYSPAHDAYKEYGAGILDAGNIVDLITNSSYSTAVMQADDDFIYSTIIIPASTTRISLVFEKYNVEGFDSSLSNLNLYLVNQVNGMVYSSTTINNNVEIIYVSSIPAGQYRLQVTNVSSSLNTQYSVAIFSKP